MRICSLLPSATETLFAIGAGETLFGVTFECDYPLEARQKRVVVRTRLSHSVNSAEIDRQVSEFVARGESLYEVDCEAVQAIQPDLIITQDLCHVCAASPGDLSTVLAALERQPEILSLNPQSLADVWGDIQKIGTAIGKTDQARELVRQLEGRVGSIIQATSQSSIRPRVACLEWIDPLFAAGHWVPEMVESAGGIDVLGKAGKRSYRTTWEDLLNASPEIIVIMPCGFNLAGAIKEFNALRVPDEWESLPAVRNGNVFAVDASGYFSRPGPRLADGVEILAGILQPETAHTPPPPASCVKVAPIHGSSRK